MPMLEQNHRLFLFAYFLGAIFGSHYFCCKKMAPFLLGPFFMVAAEHLHASSNALAASLRLLNDEDGLMKGDRSSTGKLKPPPADDPGRKTGSVDLSQMVW